MANISMNQYEKQLYSVFKTFDVDNIEALDRSAVLELCDTLQLENRGTALVDTLFEKHTDRVTFTQFRNGLLSVLGGESPPKTENSEAKSNPQTIHSIASPTHSDEDSSGREVAPKFVFGSKKYGRRSRPPRISTEVSPRQRVSSESRLDGERNRQHMKYKRSASAMEGRTDSLDDDDTGDLDHDKRVNREKALALCHGLKMHGVDQSLVDRIFKDSVSDEITVGEFFEKLNASLTSIALSVNDSTKDESVEIDNSVVSSESVVETWERAGVQKPRRLLLELGFTSTVLHPVELERALDAELNALSLPPDVPTDARSLLLLAANALSCLRLESAQKQFEMVRLERDKLCMDLAEANRRARILAQDIDENHAKIETELKANLRQLESRHAEALRVATDEVIAEKEKAATMRLELEAEISRHVDMESQLKSEIVALKHRNEDYKEQIRLIEDRMVQAERDQARLQAEAQEAEGLRASLAEREKAAADELATHLHELRLENQKLRDRNDELCAELEGSGRPTSGNFGASAASWKDESALHYTSTAALNASDIVEEGDSLLHSAGDIIVNKTLINKLRDTLENVKKTLPTSNDNCEFCRQRNHNLSSLLETVQELYDRSSCEATENNINNNVDKVAVAVQTDCNANATVLDLKKQIFDLTQRHEADRQTYTTVIKELELSLEQMKEEYEACEEYWAGKLEAERSASAAEQRASDERLAVLTARVTEYERAYCRLPAIDERRSLERHVAELDAEAAAARAANADHLAAKDEEIKNLKEEIKQLKGKLEELERRASMGGVGGGGGGGGGVGGGWGWALRARCGRAERAAQRLLARLAAADLLVKDLYLENCRLAHGAPPRPRPPPR